MQSLTVLMGGNRAIFVPSARGGKKRKQSLISGQLWCHFRARDPNTLGLSLLGGRGFSKPAGLWQVMQRNRIPFFIKQPLLVDLGGSRLLWRWKEGDFVVQPTGQESYYSTHVHAKNSPLKLFGLIRSQLICHILYKQTEMRHCKVSLHLFLLDSHLWILFVVCNNCLWTWTSRDEVSSPYKQQYVSFQSKSSSLQP